MERTTREQSEDSRINRIDRRHVIQALGFGATAALAASAVPKVASAFASRALPATMARSNKDLKAVGWDHLSFDVMDVAKSRDWYVDLFGMKVTWDDGTPNKPPTNSELDFGAPLLLDSLYVRKTKPGQNTMVDHLAWKIEHFTKSGSEAEMKEIGLNPTDDGPLGWSVKDPDGYTAQIIAKTGGWPGGAVKDAKIEEGQHYLDTIPKPSGKSFKSIGAVVYLYVTDIAKSRDFYSNLFWLKEIYYKAEEPDSECFLRFGQNDGLCLRKSQRGDNKAYVDHFAIVIADYKKDAVGAELKRRGLDPQPDGNVGWRIRDLENFPISVGGTGLLSGKAAAGA